MIIGRFQKYDEGFSGFVETLSLQLNPVRFIKRDRGADYSVRGPEDCELGAAWHKTGEWGGYLSVKLDCPGLPAPLNATMALREREDGFYFLSWQRARATEVRGTENGAGAPR